MTTLNLTNRPVLQCGLLLVGLGLWAAVYAVWTVFVPALEVEEEVAWRTIFALQSTAYVVLPVVILLPLILVPVDRTTRVIGIVLSGGLMVLHYCWPGDGLLVHLSRDLSLVALAVILGSLLGWKVAEDRHIIPAFLVLFVLDVWSVFFGLSRVISRTPKVTRHVLLGSPVVGYPAGAPPVIRPLVGPADVLILVACIAMTVKFGLGLARSGVYLAGGLFVGFLFVAFFARPLPMLPFLISAFVLAHHRTLRADPPQVLLAVTFAAVLAAVLSLIVHTLSFSAPVAG